MSELVSFIGIFFNDLKMLKKTLESVMSQDYENLECVIVDGGSVDGTVEYLQDAEKRYAPRLRWISEKDRGIDDALNKGYALAKGEIIMAGSDPFIDGHVISCIVDTILRENSDGCHGGMITFKDGRIIRKWSGKKGHVAFGWMPATPTLAIKRSVLERYGGRKGDSYKGAGDYEYILRILKDKTVRLSAIAKPLVAYEAGGISNAGVLAFWLGIKERYRALKENKYPLPAFTTCCAIARTLASYIFVIRKKRVL